MKIVSRIAIIHPIIKPPISPPVNKAVCGAGLTELADVVVPSGMEVFVNVVSSIEQSGANKLSNEVAQRGSTWSLNESTKIEACLV